MSGTDDRGRREFLKGSAAAALAMSCWGRPTPAWAEDPPHVHGMAIVGEQSVYLSHLPLFGPIHHFQVLLEVTFAKPGSDPQGDYFKDRKSSGRNPYTLQPEPFVLASLAAAEPLRSFKANIHRGHYERRKERPRQIAQDVDVTVTRVIHFRDFDPAPPKPKQLEYLLFGKGSELFLAHLITRPPDFDQILSVKIANQTFTDDELSRGVTIVVPGSTNSASKRIGPGGPVSAQVKGAGAATPKTLQLQPGAELYFEPNELKERSAGFNAPVRAIEA